MEYSLLSVDPDVFELYLNIEIALPGIKRWSVKRIYVNSLEKSEILENTAEK